jgi:hypothetical protein
MWDVVLCCAASLSVIVYTCVTLKYDNRTDEEKLSDSKKALGYAVGVPGMFNQDNVYPLKCACSEIERCALHEKMNCYCWTKLNCDRHKGKRL